MEYLLIDIFIIKTYDHVVLAV